jgi:hypothetical protein
MRWSKALRFDRRAWRHPYSKHKPRSFVHHHAPPRCDLFRAVRAHRIARYRPTLCISVKQIDAVELSHRHQYSRQRSSSTGREDALNTRFSADRLATALRTYLMRSRAKASNTSARRGTTGRPSLFLSKGCPSGRSHWRKFRDRCSNATMSLVRDRSKANCAAANLATGGDEHSRAVTFSPERIMGDRRRVIAGTFR